MTDQACSRCPALEAEIARLQDENAKLRGYIDYLLSILERIRRYAQDVTQESERVLSGHHPRGTWSFWRGCKQVAEKVQQLVRG